jgi:hypothetical protein
MKRFMQRYVGQICHGIAAFFTLVFLGLYITFQDDWLRDGRFILGILVYGFTLQFTAEILNQRLAPWPSKETDQP